MIFGVLGCTVSRPLPQGSSAPDFSLPTLENPAVQITLSELNRETPVLLVFWATWCPNCVEEIPALNELQSKYSGKGLKILAVNLEESRKTVEEFVKKQPISYPVVLDERGKTSNLYNLSGIPIAVLLEKGGKVLYYGYSVPPVESLLTQKENSSL